MRKLGLKKETLVQLTSEELVGIVGGTFPSKYDCTESHQICNPLSRDHCLVIARPTRSCIPTQTC